MRLNENTCLVSSATAAVLVPYKKSHVLQYHEWMQSSELRELTASEPLSLRDEYENMDSWRTDDKKLTFIILDRSVHPKFMAGDVNLYLLGENDNGEQEAEIEVMIAEKTSRRKGLAKDALNMMMFYALEHFPVHVFVAKILDQNQPSIELFSKKMSFKEERRVKAFGEIHYHLGVKSMMKDRAGQPGKTWFTEAFQGSPYSDTFDTAA